jgi:hypothetical protein
MYYLYLRYIGKHFTSNAQSSISNNISWYLHTLCAGNAWLLQQYAGTVAYIVLAACYVQVVWFVSG